MSEGSSTLAALLDSETRPLMYRTLRNMQFRQLGGIAERKLRHALVPRLPVDFDARYEASIPSELTTACDPVAANTDLLRECLPEHVRGRFRQRSTALTDGEVTFRNRTLAVDWSKGFDWFDEALPPPPTLWGLQFHGFSYLAWPIFGFDDPGECPAVVDTVEDWLEEWTGADETTIGSEGYLRRAWTPHSVSLRLLHWIRYYAWAVTSETTPFARRLRRLIFKHAHFLSNHVEFDVGGNHIIENGAALAVAGTFFPDAGRDWHRQGYDVMETASSQFLTDGGHFERSPMYHSLTLTRYLTVVDLLERTDRSVPESLRCVVRAGSRYLAAIEPPDGRLPLLNDATFGMALPLQACLAYADAVARERVPDTGQPGLASASSVRTVPNGYYWLGTGADRLLVDGGAIGPPHLPAHSHNDHFAVLWWVDGVRVLSDTGVYEYLPTDERHHARSVASHNTVQYGDVEPIPIGGSYLFGRRIDPTVRFGQANGVTYFDGRYRRLADSGPQYRHRRQLFAGDRWWLVWDRVRADAPDRVRSRLHFDPAVGLERSSDHEHRLDVHLAESSGDDAPLAACYPLAATAISRQESRYFPEFGRSLTRPSVTLHARGDDVVLGYLLASEPVESIAVERDGNRVVGLSLNGKRHGLRVGQ